MGALASVWNGVVKEAGLRWAHDSVCDIHQGSWPGTQDPTSSLLFPSYLILCGSFLQPCLFKSPSASCQLVFSENYSTCGCIFNVFVVGGEFHVLLLYCLHLLPKIKKKKVLKIFIKYLFIFIPQSFWFILNNSVSLWLLSSTFPLWLSVSSRYRQACLLLL